MTLTNGYTTVAVVKSRLDIANTSSDADLEGIIEGVSREIDNYTRRRFYTADETRYYTPDCRTEVLIDDVVSVSVLKTDDTADRTYATTWSTASYDLKPYNASLDKRPYTSVIVAENSAYEFPAGIKKGIMVSGSFGYCTTSNIPKPIVEACIIQAVRIFKRKDAPFGVMGSAEMGNIMVIAKLDPDVKLFLDPYKRIV